MSTLAGTAALARFGVTPAALYTVGVFAISWLTTSIKFPAAHAMMVSLTMGIFLAVLLLSDKREWLQWSVLAYACDVLVCITLHGEPAGRAAGEGLAHAMGPLLTAVLIRRFNASPFQLSTLREVLLLSLFSLVPGAILCAGIECAIDAWEHRPVSWMDFLRYWTGFSLAGLAVAPVLLTLFAVRGKSNLFEPQRRLEALALKLSTALIAHGVWTSPLPLVFLLLPVLVWNATRFDIASMTLSLILVALIALHHTGAGTGPYADPSLTIEMGAVMLQSFIAIAAFGGMVLSSIMAQRRTAFDSLVRVQQELEARVAARTTALSESERQLRENEERFRLARGAARIIVVDWEIAPDILTFSDSPEWLRGPLPKAGRYPLFKDQVHPEDRASFLEVRQRALDTVSGQTNQFRLVRTDGVVLHIQSYQTVVAGADGKALRLLAILHDVTERRQIEIALHESERRLRALLDTIPDEVRLKDTAGRYLMVNRAAREYAGRAEAEIIGHTIFDLRPLDIAQQIDEADRAALAAGQMTRMERRSFFDADGWREIINFPIRDEHGVISGLVSIGRDITERKKAELDALREREERYRTLVEQAGDLIYRADVRGYFTYTNSTAAEDMLGYTREDLIGHHYSEFVREDYRESAQTFYLRQFKERIPATYFEMPVITKDGRTLWVGQRVQLVMDKEWVLYYQAVCRDISDRVMAQQALQEFNAKLRQLTARQEDLLEAERTRIAHDLHDGIGQSLNLARIKLSALSGRGGLHDHESALKELMRIIDETSAVIRTMEFDLSPPVLRELGLEPALEWLAEEMRRVYGLKVKLSTDGEPKPLSQVVRAVAFRSVRELLINVVRHAGTLEAHVDTQVDNGFAVITVSDEGKGFEPDATVRGLGLTSVNERMTHVGGSATIAAVRGEGAVISLLLPLEGTDPRRISNDNSSDYRR